MPSISQHSHSIVGKITGNVGRYRDVKKSCIFLYAWEWIENALNCENTCFGDNLPSQEFNDYNYSQWPTAYVHIYHHVNFMFNNGEEYSAYGTIKSWWIKWDLKTSGEGILHYSINLFFPQSNILSLYSLVFLQIEALKMSSKTERISDNSD